MKVSLVFMVILVISMWTLAKLWKGRWIKFAAFYVMWLVLPAYVSLQAGPSGLVDAKSIFGFSLLCIGSLTVLLKLRISESEANLLLFWRHSDLKGSGNEEEEKIGVLIKWLLGLTYSLCALYFIFYGPINS